MKRKHFPDTSAAAFAVSIFVFSVIFLSQDALAGSVVVQNGQLVASGLDVGQGALFVNSTTGFVGIGAGNASGAGGATGPARPLHVTAAQDAVIRLQDSSGAGPAAYVEFYNDTSRWGYVGLGGHDDKMTIGTTAEKSLAFYTNDSPKMVLTAGGNVGIGTTSPQQKLVVGGNLTVGHEWDGATTAAPVYFGKPASGGGFGAGSAFMTFVDAGSGAGVNYGTSIAFTPHQGGSAQTEAMRIAGNGNVGIGTASPIVKLDVNGSLRVSPDPWDNSVIFFGNASGSMKWHLVRLGYDGSLRVTESGIADRVTIQNGTGNVGIGTTSPSQKLEVAGNIKSNLAGIQSGTVDTTAGWTSIGVLNQGLLILKGTYGGSTYAISNQYGNGGAAVQLQYAIWCTGYPVARRVGSGPIEVSMTGAECDNNKLVSWIFIGFS